MRDADCLDAYTAAKAQGSCGAKFQKIIDCKVEKACCTRQTRKGERFS